MAENGTKTPFCGHESVLLVFALTQQDWFVKHTPITVCESLRRKADALP
jgi:hypothetical protein